MCTHTCTHIDEWWRENKKGNYKEHVTKYKILQ